ncbi:hypothetical protein ERJ75_001777200 [Trypanosoma vivax]|nr:hypothetical protein ERJ75_001777200 [Trypanosoma vivax]
MGSERGRVAVRLAWVTAGRCDEIALLRKKEFIGHPSDRNALVVDWGALPKTLEAGTRRAARCVAIAGADAAAMGRLIAKTVAWERLAALGARFGKSLAALRRDGVFDKTGRAGARGRGGGRTRFGPESSDAAGETRGATRAAMRHRAVPGTLGRRFEQLREVDGPHEEGAPGMVKLPCAPARAACKGRVPMPLFNGRGALGRTRITRAAAEEEQWRLPLQRARRRLNNKALRRFAAVWRNAPRSPEPHPPSRDTNLRIGEPDAKEMDRVGVVREAAPITCGGLGGCPSPL